METGSSVNRLISIAIDSLMLHRDYIYRIALT